MYCNEGNDILTAFDMHAALTAHPVKGTSSSVNKINQSVSHIKVKELNHFSAFHNFKYEEDGIRVWQAHDIGQGKKFKYEDVYITTLIFWLMKSSLSNIHQDCLYQLKKKQLRRRRTDYFTVLKKSVITPALRLMT